MNTPENLFPSYQPILTEMIRKSKKYLITTETREILIVRPEQDTIRGFCTECGRESEMFGLDAAVTFSGKRAREIFALVETGAVHSVETKTGHLLVCKNSLFTKTI